MVLCIWLALRGFGVRNLLYGLAMRAFGGYLLIRLGLVGSELFGRKPYSLTACLSVKTAGWQDVVCRSSFCGS